MWKKWMPVLSIGSVIIFFIWGFIEGTYEHNWVAFFLVPLGMFILKAVDKGEDGGNKGDKSQG